MDPDDDEVMVVARRAWDGFVLGHASGDWAAFLETLSDDVTFFTPVAGSFQGANSGKDRAIEFAHYLSAQRRKLLQYQSPVRVSREGATVVFEAWDDASMTAGSISNRIALSLDVEDAKVITIREYVGLMD